MLYAVIILAVALIAFTMTFSVGLLTTTRNVGFSVTTESGHPSISGNLSEGLNIENASENVTQEIADAYAKSSQAYSNLYNAIAVLFIFIGLGILIYSIGYTYDKFRGKNRSRRKK